MRAVIQRVRDAGVEASGHRAAIQRGLLVYLGVHRDDGESDVAYLVDKVRHLRVFDDESGRLNLDVSQAGGEILVISAFTVQADARRGRRPSLEPAAQPDRALILYDAFCQSLAQMGLRVQRGAFGDPMLVRSINDGPVCVLLDSRRVF